MRGANLWRQQQAPEHDRVTVRVPVDDLDDLDALIEADEYANRSEAIRTSIKRLIESEGGR